MQQMLNEGSQYTNGRGGAHKYILIFSVFISWHHVLKQLQPALLQEYLLARAAKHNKKVLLIGDLGDWIRAHRYPEPNEKM